MSNPYQPLNKFPAIGHEHVSATGNGSNGAGSKAKARYPHKPLAVDRNMDSGNMGKLKTRANDSVGGRPLKGY